jgi:hypothetical protein
MSFYICLTANEWRNLCSMGRIRLHESRAVSDQLETDFFDTFFALSLDRFALRDTSDFLIVECIILQQTVDGFLPPGKEVGVSWLCLDQIIRFFPIQSDDAWAFEIDATKAQVVIGSADFEPQWLNWSRNQTATQGCMDGLALCRILGLGNETSMDRSELLQWRELAVRVIYPSSNTLELEDIKGFLLDSAENLFELVREDSVKGSVFVSGPIEWINLRSNTNVLEHDLVLAEQAQGLHEKFWSLDFDPLLAVSEDIVIFSNTLEEKFPDMFPRPWSPSLIALFIRYCHLIKYSSVKPEEIIAAVNAVKRPDDQSLAQLLSFLLGVLLGANKVHALDRLLNAQRFKIATQIKDAAPITDSVSTGNPLCAP